MTSNDQLKRSKNRILAGWLLVALFCAFALPARAYALDVPNALPSLNAFIEAVKDGNAGSLRGIYVPNVMALAVVQQPAGDSAYVSLSDAVVTQSGKAAEFGNVGLLAHNFLAGSLFSNLKRGDVITLVYGDGRVEVFLVNNIQSYQALEPLNTYSQFVNTETQTLLGADELFNQVYGGEYHLALQTCIEQNGELSWGRLFVMATPLKVGTFSRLKKY